jgi:hypothetical protein
MPNRIIKESALDSDDLAQLSNGAERLFWRLTLVADDFGRFDGAPQVVKARCFPRLVDKLRTNEIEAWMKELEPKLVRFYAANGRPYGCFLNWLKHQQKRAKVSKFPDPPPPDSNCNQTQTNVLEIENRDRIRVRNNTSPPKSEELNWASPQKLVELYNELTPDECPTVDVLSPARRDKAKKYLAMFPEEQFWLDVFKRVHRSRFLRGLNSTAGHQHFRFNFDWMLTKGQDGSENVVKVHEGRYQDKE